VARIYVVRHAEAAPGHPDEARGLTAAGEAQARALGARLAAEAPDAVVSSPLLRARQTAEQIGLAAGVGVEVEDRLAPGADADAVLAAVAGRGERVVVVGHQPDCGEVVAALGGEPAADFPPAGVHTLDV
jgi:phosphohistidine phosphatase